MVLKTEAEIIDQIKEVAGDFATEADPLVVPYLDGWLDALNWALGEPVEQG